MCGAEAHVFISARIRQMNRLNFDEEILAHIARVLKKNVNKTECREKERRLKELNIRICTMQSL